MGANVIPGRGSFDSRMAGTLAGAAALVVILGALLGPSVLTTHPDGSPSATEIAVGPSATAGPVTTVGPTPGVPTEPPEAWADLDVPPYEPTAAFEPVDHDRLGVGSDSAFTLRSLTKTPAVTLARGLRTDPPLTFTVTAGATSGSAVLRPTSPLVEGLRYRVRLDAPDGSLAGAWAFTARAPLQIVETLPADHATQVPVNTGIEITFDQDGTRDVAKHFSIKPAVAGRFEQHARTWAFVPDKALKAATIYTVTVTSGVPVADSSVTLEEGIAFRFETALPSQGTPRISFGRVIYETRPGERLTLSLREIDDEDSTKGSDVPSSVTVDIHRLPTFAAAVDAAYALAGPDSWALNAPGAVVDTSGLTLVARVDGKVVDSYAGPFVQLPFEPSAGFYVVTIVQNGPPEQLLLQVTNVAAYALTGTKDTVVWVNDLRTNAALGGASVVVARGTSLGQTGTDGILRVGTPASLRDPVPGSGEAPGPHFLTIRAADGRRVIVPIGLQAAWYSSGYEGPYNLEWTEQSPDWWLLFHTDRTAYRQTDTINVYGMVRARSDRSVPDEVELRLRPEASSADLAVVRRQVKPTDRGVFNASLRITDLPRGSYMLDLLVGTKRVAAVWVSVTDIRKPAYRIDVQTDRHVYVLGQQVTVSAQAAFYDGTPVPGIDLRFSAFDTTATATAGALGKATAKLKAVSTYEPDGWFNDYVGVAPMRPEEGQIDGTAEVVLLPSRAWIAGTGTLSDGKIVVRGTLSWADIKGMEATLDAGRSLDYETAGPGRPIAGGTVRAEVFHVVPRRTQVGTTYDFIEKKVVPVYEYDSNDVSLGTWTLTAASDGTFRLSVPAPVAKDAYYVTLRTRDPEGRLFRRTVYASRAIEIEQHPAPYLDSTGYCGYRPPRTAELNEPFTVTMHEGTGSVASGGRFLFLVSERGSIETTVQDAATFSRTLRNADLPGFTVRAVWLADGAYAVSDVDAIVNPDDKRITVTLVPDKSRYQPGADASVAITTTGPDGRPVAADVIVQGVDEKLYTMGYAVETDPAPELMHETESGFLQSYTTHFLPVLNEGGCGGAGGGGDDRADFKDAVTFQRVRTGTNGHAAATFKLSDDLTSWRITATAVDNRLDSGYATLQLPVGLPFFVDAVLAPEYLSGEQAVMSVRAFGSALPAGARVRFNIQAPSLGLPTKSATGNAFALVRVPLPTLTAGDHRVRIEATVAIGGKTYRDALVRTIHVVATRLSGLVASYDLLEAGFSPQGGPGLTTYSITDAGRGRLVSLLQQLAWDRSGRFDKQAAATLARQTLIDEFGFKASQLPETGFDASRYERDGITLLSYGSADLFLSAKAALVVPDLVGSEGLRGQLAYWAEESTATRERKIVALAGLAGLGDDVLSRLRAFAPSELTVREQLWLALGLAAAGDESSARAIERDLLETAGQRLGPWVRVAAGTTLRDTIEASGLLLMLAGRLGDPLGHEVSQYLLNVTAEDLVFPLEQLGYIRGFLERLPRDPARFAWSVAGDRHAVTLDRGGGYTLALTSEQRKTFKLERLAGDLAVVTTWTSPDAPLPTSPSISVSRSVTPAGNAPSDRLVRVSITVGFGAQSLPGCYRLTDLAPSGLTPVVATAGWPGDEEEDGYSPANWPYSSVGQEVSWCASPSDKSHVYAYSARVVSPGTYRWEPAVLQFEPDPRIGASTEATSYTIR